MKKHSDLIHQTKWDVLIVLDACRWDDFCRVFGHDLMFNSMKPVDSEACTTPQWLKKHWSGYYPDIVYISANPFINSKGTSFGGYTATKHFNDIIDLWNEVDEYERVKPSLVSDTAVFNILLDSALKQLGDSGGRFIVHFLQPHAPYYFQHNPQKLRRFIKKYVPIKWWMTLRRIFKSSSKKVCGLESRYAKVYTPSEIKQAYRMNLLTTLEPVMEIIQQCKEEGLRVIITSDHAEFLGENNQWGHRQSDNDLIRTVPWVVIE